MAPGGIAGSRTLREPGGGWSVVAACALELGEHPLWDDEHARLVWVDLLGGAVLTLQPDGMLQRWPTDAPAGCAALRAGGGLVVAAGGQMHHLDDRGFTDQDPVDLPVSPGTRLNDGAVDPQGRLLVGTADTRGGSAGALLRVDGRSVEVLLEGVSESNGLAWSPDGAVLYYVDSGEPAIRRYAYGPSRLDRLKDLATCEPRVDGVPDGLTVDAAGGVWVALWEGGQVRRYSPEGALVVTLRLPVSRPTCPVLGGQGGGTLFVTTAWEGMDDSARRHEPWAGHVLAHPVAESRLPAHLFAG